MSDSITPAEILEIRTAAALTQAQAGHAVGVTEGCWRHWERGRRNPNRFVRNAIRDLRPKKRSGKSQKKA